MLSAALRRASTLVKCAAPQFSAPALVDGAIAQFDSASLRGRYWLLLFYPLDLYARCDALRCG